MLPVKRSFFPTFSKFFDDDWNSLFDWNSRHFSNTSTTLPSVNVKETDQAYTVEMAAPGMKKDDFQIEFNDNTLTIKSESRHEDEHKEGDHYTRREFSYQSFQRSFTLNRDVVDATGIEATYTDGILRINLPKKEEAKPKPVRTIEIS